MSAESIEQGLSPEQMQAALAAMSSPDRLSSLSQALLSSGAG